MATIAASPRERSYEIGLIVVLTLANGVIGFDRQTVAFLAPYIVGDLGLNNTQVGWLAAALSLAIAGSSFFASEFADRTGKRKIMLIACTLLFSLMSGVGGLALTFGVLLATRFALGLAEGPIVPMSQTLIVRASEPRRRGINMGITQMVGAFGIAGFLGPIAATQIADSYGWRTAMFLSIVPGLIVAGMMVFLLRPDEKPLETPHTLRASPFASFSECLKIPNIRISLAIAGLFTAWLVIQAVFGTLFLTQVKGLAPTTAGWVVGMFGWGGLIGGLALPLLSDRIGRKPVMVAGAIAGIAGPIAYIVLPSDPVLLGIATLIGALPLGIGPLYCATVPTESVSPALTTTAVGLSMGTAELFGGVVAPMVAGPAADAYGLDAVYWIAAGVALAAAVPAMFLKETAPCKVGGMEA